MSGYGRDESAPTPDGVFVPHFVVDVGNWRSIRNQFRGGRGGIGECSHSISWVVRKHSPNVRNVFAICLITFVKYLQRVGYLNVTFSQNKRVVFALQKYGFWRAKRGFLMDKNRVLHF